MKRRLFPFALIVLSSLPGCLYSQPWSGILQPTYGTGACTVGSTSSPGMCAIDWTTAGIPGGIPSGSWAQSGSTIAASQSPCNNGSGDCTSTIQAALNACSGSKYVLLGAGTFLIDGSLTVPSNCALRGSGANSTILNTKGSAGGAPAVSLGAASVSPNNSNSTAITGGATGGSTSITLASASGISAGMYLLITELNNTNYVNISGSEGACTWCDGGTGWNGTRVRGQIVEVESVSGTTINISPGLYSAYGTALPGRTAGHQYPYEAFINPSGSTHYYEQTVNNGGAPYTCTTGSGTPTFPTNGTSVSDGTCTWQDMGVGTTTQPLATYFSASAKYAGVENLQVYQNNTGYGADFEISMCAYCWISGVEGNYADGDHVQVSYGYRGQIQNSYFSNAYIHGPGSYDSDVTLYNKSSGMLVQNNILERLHVGIMLEWGAAGNVIAYNYSFGNYASGSTTFGPPGLNTHGAHPQFNLFEGNIVENFTLDSIWGSHSSNTAFRNWTKGTTKLCSTGTTGRAPVSCSTPATWAVQYNAAVDIDFLGSAYNLIGNIIGSQDMASLTHYNDGVTPLPQVNEVVAACGPLPCGPGSRSYDYAAYAFSLGFGEASDDGSSGNDSIVPYSTLFLHGNYTSPTAALTWLGSLTHTLPASFYLSGQPSWFGNVPWPAIGPDVKNGLSDSYGYAYAIPAEVCYESVMGGTDGTGSPLAFNASNCYASSSGTSLTAPATVSAAIH